VDREEAVRTLEEGYAATRALVGKLDDEAFARPATIGGGDWSAKDLLCHLMFWERNALEALEDWADGRAWRSSDAFDEPGGDDRLNAAAYEEFAGLSGDEARAGAAAVHVSLVAAVHDLDDADWSRAVPGEESRTWGEGSGDILQGMDGAAFRHAWAHLDDLRAYAG
jgi:hypothetical protein